MLHVKAIVEFEYKATVEDELNLKVGDIITNIQQVEEGWCRGQLNGNIGMFPDNFVKMIEEKVATSKPPSKEILRMVKVMFPYQPANEDELKLEPGDIVSVIADEEEGWARGILKDKEGVFPTNFTEIHKPKSVDNQQAEKPSVETSNKKGFGNIFDEGPIKLRSTSKTDADKILPSTDKTASLIHPVKSDGGGPIIKTDVVKEVKRYKVIFDYNAENDDELTLTKGQVVNVINMDLPDAGWWLGTISGPDGSVTKGVFPDNFVAPLSTVDEDSLKKSDIEVKTTENKTSKILENAAVEAKQTSTKPSNQPQNSLSLKRPAPKAPNTQITKPQLEKTSIPSATIPETIDDMLPVTEDSKLTHFKRPAGPKNRKRPDANNRREKAKESSNAADKEMTSSVDEQEKVLEASDVIEEVPTSPVGDSASVTSSKRDHKRGGIQVMPMMTTSDASIPTEKPSWMKQLKSRKSDKRSSPPVSSAKEETKPAWLTNLAKKKPQPPSPMVKPVVVSPTSPTPANKPAATSVPASKPAATSVPASKPVATSVPANKPAATSVPASKPVASATPASKPVETSKIELEKTRLESSDIAPRSIEDDSDLTNQRKAPKPSDVKKSNAARPLSMQFLLNTVFQTSTNFQKIFSSKIFFRQRNFLKHQKNQDQ